MKTFHLKIMVLLLLCAGLLLIFQGCSIKKPEAPSWETTWDLPLTSKQYSINDIMDQLDSSIIAFDESNNPYFSITQEVDTIMVDDNLPAVDDISQSFKEGIPEVEIAAPTIPQIKFGNDEFGIPINAFDSVFFAIPIALDTTDLAAFTTFDSAAVSQGKLQIEVTNDLGVNINSLNIEIFNKTDLSQIGAANFNTIPHNSTNADTIDLALKTLRNQLSIVVTGNIPVQSIQTPVNDSSLTITSSFVNNITVSSARAELPDSINIDINEIIDLNFDSQSTIHEAELSSGSLSLPIANNTGLPMEIYLSIPNFEFDGAPLTIDTSLTAQENKTVIRNLAGYIFKPDTTTDPQSIAINASVVVPPSGAGNMYDISISDSIQISAVVSNVAFNSVTGQIAPTTIDIGLDPQAVDELPEGFDQAQLTRAELTMYLYNNSTSDIAVDLQLASDQPGVNPLVVDTTVGAKGFGASVPQETIISIGSLVLSSFLNPLPTQISIDGSAIFNPSGGVVTISTEDFFYGEVEIYSPLAFALIDTTEIELDTSDVEMNPEDMPDFQETFVYGVINAELTSQLPVGARVGLKIIAAGDLNIVTVGPFTLESAITDDDGIAVEPVVSAFVDTLTSSEIAIFENENVYIIPQIELLPTGPNGSMIQGSDYIHISASAEFRVIGGEHLWNDDDN